MKTYSAKPSEVTRKWYILDAKDMPLGRLSTIASTILMGKKKPMFTKHIDCGDYLIVINSDQLVVTGQKETAKKYYHHSHYPGGLKETSLAEQRIKDSTKIVEHSIRGMLPVNKLRDMRLKRLRIFPDDNHNHQAQNPVIITKESK